MELLFIIGETWRIRRLAACDHRTLLHQVAKLLKDRESHALASSTEVKNSIARAAGSYEPSILERKLIQQHIAVDEVESIAIRCILLRLPSEHRRQRPFLSVEVGHISVKVPLLQQV